MNETVKARSLAPEVGSFIGSLHRDLDAQRMDLLHKRIARRKQLSDGEVDHLADTLPVRQGKWKVDPMVEEAMERRVELIGGTTRSELINGLNAGAKSYIADLWNFTAQDTWSILRAHRSLTGAAKLDLAYLDVREGRVRVNPNSTTRSYLVPRPLYVHEGALLVNDDPVSAGAFDLSVALLSHGRVLFERQGFIGLYLRDVHGHLEARHWVQMIQRIEEYMGLPRGAVRATVMIDTIAGALEAEEILFELMHHSAGLSLDPQAYAADHIALFHGPDIAVLPDRETIGLNAPMLRALSLYTIGICHRRGCHAMGAPSFVLPAIDHDKVKTEYLEMLADKEREAVDGHDGTLVVHEDMVNASMVEFNKSMPRAHQMGYQRNDTITPADLIRRPEGSISVESLKSILRTAFRSLTQRDEGKGWVIQGGRIHDRSSLLLAIRLLWQWNHSSQGIITATNFPVTADLIGFMLKKEADKMFDMNDPAIKKRVEKAMAHIMEMAIGEGVPMV